jgi:myo-inositol-1(or 4)-monophosphatase
MNLLQLVDKTKEIAKDAGDFIAAEALKFKSESIEYKDINNVVSYVDKEAERIIVDKLQQLLPEAGFITEEETIENNTPVGLNWIIDPLDGTANFIHGLPHYSVSIALYEDKKALIGVVYEVCRNNMFWAYKGGGAYLNENRISVSKNETLSESLIATGFPYYKFDEMQAYLHILESLMQKTHGLRRAGSAALDLAYVAVGYYDGFFEYNLRSWDMAAGVLLVTEAGGKVCDFEGMDDYVFGGNIVAGAQIHGDLLKEIQAFWPKNS